jgi:hypothetical protein
MVDLNAPHARGKEALRDLSEAVAMINDMNPKLNCSIVRLADAAQTKSLRGLHDEEKEVTDHFFRLKQHCDTRWVELFSTPGKTNFMKKVSFGRVCVNFENMTENMWLQHSELCIFGRPTADEELASDARVPVAALPLQSELLQPVSASPDKDIMTGERFRPGEETLRAQKGPSRDEVFLESLLKGARLSGPVLIVNLCGYVEDAGVAALALVIDNSYCSCYPSTS